MVQQAQARVPPTCASEGSAQAAAAGVPSTLLREKTRKASPMTLAACGGGKN